MQNSHFMGVTDLNCPIHPCILPLRTPEEDKDVYRHTRVFTDHGLPATSYLPKVRGPLSRRTVCQAVPVSRPLSRDGVRPANVPREPARYRRLSACPSEQAVPLWAFGPQV